MTGREIKTVCRAAFDLLAQAGIQAEGLRPAEIAEGIMKLTGTSRRSHQKQTDFIKRWVDECKGPVNPAYKREFKPMNTKALRHPRIADINAAQPPLITPDGIGNGAERQHGFGRGS